MSSNAKNLRDAQKLPPSKHASVLHVSTVHQPFDTRIFERQCRTLADAGYNVRFLVPHSHEQERDGVGIVPLKRHRSRVLRLLFGGPTTLLACLRLKPDLVCVHDPELIPVALAMKLFGRRACYDAHEDYAAYFRGHPRLPGIVRLLLATLIRPLEAAALRWLDFVIAATPAIAQNFNQPGATVTVQNFPSVPELSSANFEDRDLRIAYLGELNEERGARELLDALSLLAPQLDAKLAFAGVIQPETLKQELQQHPGWKQVEDNGWISATEVQELLGSCRVGIVPFKPLPNHVESQPRKLFEYMAAGLPVVATDFPLWKGFIDQHRAGITVPPTPKGIARALETLLTDPDRCAEEGRAGHAAAQSHFSWEGEVGKLLEAYSRCLG